VILPASYQKGNLEISQNRLFLDEATASSAIARKRGLHFLPKGIGIAK